VLSRSPLFLRSSRTPPPGGPGLRLGPPSYRPGGRTYIHGALALPADTEDPARWLAWVASLTCTVVSEPNQSVWSHYLATPAAAERARRSDGEVAFHFDLADAVGQPLPRCAVHVHLAARQWTSAVVRLPEQDARVPSEPRPDAVERLIDARALLASGATEAARDALRAAHDDLRRAAETASGSDRADVEARLSTVEAHLDEIDPLR
jgi:hypothetical protein